MESSIEREITPVEELAKIARENRKFEILQRERAMSDAQRAKNKSAKMAGICILGAIVAGCFNNHDVNVIVQHELNAIYSWEALKQYFNDLGPAETLLWASAASFVGLNVKASKKFKRAQNELIDLNASLESNETLGGTENVRTR